MNDHFFFNNNNNNNYNNGLNYNNMFYNGGQQFYPPNFIFNNPYIETSYPLRNFNNDYGYNLTNHNPNNLNNFFSQLENTNTNSFFQNGNFHKKSMSKSNWMLNSDIGNNQFNKQCNFSQMKNAKSYSNLKTQVANELNQNFFIRNHNQNFSANQQTKYETNKQEIPGLNSFYLNKNENSIVKPIIMQPSNADYNNSNLKRFKIKRKSLVEYAKNNFSNQTDSNSNNAIEFSNDSNNINIKNTDTSNAQKKQFNMISNRHNFNGSKLNNGVKKFNRTNGAGGCGGGSRLNSLDDYNLNNLDEKMLQLSIENCDLKSNSSYKSLNKNNSLDSLSNVKLKNPNNNNNNSNANIINKKVKKPSNNDQFEAYRLENDSKQINEFLKLDSKVDNLNQNQETENSSNKNSNPDSKNDLPSKKKANKHHHHHRSKRNKNRKNNLKKSDSNPAMSNKNDDEKNLHHLNKENHDSLCAFDFSNTDEFWEDDIVINSELIGTDNLSIPIKEILSLSSSDELSIDDEKNDFLD